MVFLNIEVVHSLPLKSVTVICPMQLSKVQLNQNGRHKQSHANSVVVSLQVCLVDDFLLSVLIRNTFRAVAELGIAVSVHWSLKHNCQSLNLIHGM